ncbi:MAG: DUF3427 domain-containing protein [Acidimicrobiales bacterium]
MGELKPGLYEELVTEALDAQLEAWGDVVEIDRGELRSADAANRIALHLAHAVERALDGVGESERVDVGIRLARKLLDQVGDLLARADVEGDRPVDPGQLLHGILRLGPDGAPRTLDQPLVPLLDTTLLTNSPGEPRVGSQLVAEIESADRIDVVMAFIRRSGIRPLLERLRRHCDDEHELRVLTTTYTGSTEQRALDELRDLGAKIRVSYDESSTRLHAKAWLLHRESGYSTAYIGSSNLTHSAQVTGLEWNVRVSGRRNPDVVAKVAAVFESYWESGDFVPYDATEFTQRTGATPSAVSVLLPPTELRLEPFQERLLEQVELARVRGRHRNLLVSATGTGKTVMAAVDYARLRDRLRRSRLLFVAHRKEILDQSRRTFAHALRDASFGELWVGGARPTGFEHVFASVQSLHATGVDHIEPDHFDVVIIDEFHRTAAPSYQRLLDRLRPVELLGLTATPERSDGLPVLDWFDGRIAAELRLWDAVDQQRLSPFAYYGIGDDTDLSRVPWRRGQGYDIDALTSVYTSDDAWARFVVKQVDAHVDDVKTMRALGFCVSVDHARFMARHFTESGVISTAIWADTPPVERQAALDDLAAGRIHALFSVDLFNEGVDVPVVDTVLFLRPTDSPTLFLQQLGRGLRKAPGKTVCTVLDFVGRHRREFRFDRRFRALLGGTRKDLERQIDLGFPFLPAGCHMELDRLSSERVLANVREAIPSRWTAKVDELRSVVVSGRDARLGTFLDETGMELDDVYTADKSWSDLCEAAGVQVLPPGPDEAPLRRAVGRMLHVDDDVRIEGLRRLLRPIPQDVDQLSERDRRITRMLVASVGDKVLSKAATLKDAVELLTAHPQVLAELEQLFDVLEPHINHLQPPLSELPDVPLRVHARYTRREILAAFGVASDAAKVKPWQTGVWWASESRSDLLAFTLDKTSGSFSPTTRYRDYAINRDLIHWESQGTTRAESETGRRYRDHRARGTQVMLFARLRQDERAFWFLGPASFEDWNGEERPMGITWRLENPLPGDLFASFAAAVA